MMTVTRLLTIMMTILLAPETMERAPVTPPVMSRMTLLQQQACFQDRARVVCRCQGEPETQGPSYLGVRMQGFLINNNNNNIRSPDIGAQVEVRDLVIIKGNFYCLLIDFFMLSFLL